MLFNILAVSPLNDTKSQIALVLERLLLYLPLNPQRLWASSKAAAVVF